MVEKHIHQHIQSILVPKGHFKNEAQARHHVEQMGFQTNVKPVHITDNFYRYRQYHPHTGEQFRTVKIGQDKAIYSLGTHGNSHIVGHDHHGILRQPHIHMQPKAEVQKSHYNHQPIVGANGHGIWLDKYKPDHLKMDKLDPTLADNKKANQKSFLTPATPLKPWAQANIPLDQREHQSYYQVDRKRAKKYF